jgi:phosphopantothenoylcysteine decarboxylase/phosphopantothenate--cysteine ligase
MEPTETVLAGRKILVGISGGIAAYKSAELVRLLKRSGCEVQVLMTPDAARFITPLTLGTLSEREVLSEIFPENADGSWTRHVSLGLWADLFVIAPATAQTIAKLAGGFSDSMLTATALAARCSTLVCPSMDHDMYVHPATAANLETLVSYGYRLMETAHGELASGLVGKGRLPEPEEILARIASELTQKPGFSSRPLKGRTVLVTAGPTREALDAVRFITNPSTGSMGFALARAAAQAGGSVTLVSGPSTLTTPEGVHRIDVTTAAEMHKAVLSSSDVDIVFMAAAVADYAPAEPAEGKIKKTADDLVIRMQRTKDILADLGRRKRPGQFLVGFALETEEGEAHARRKMEKKSLDLIVLNYANEPGSGFGTDTNRVMLISSEGPAQSLPLMDKSAVAEQIVAASAQQMDRLLDARHESR